MTIAAVCPFSVAFHRKKIELKRFCRFHFQQGICSNKIHSACCQPLRNNRFVWCLHMSALCSKLPVYWLLVRALELRQVDWLADNMKENNLAVNEAL